MRPKRQGTGLNMVRKEILLPGSIARVIVCILAVAMIGCPMVAPAKAASPPTDVATASGDKSITISWAPVAGATSYNVYWSTSPGVSVETGAKIAGVVSPFTHDGLANGTTYYYIVTAVDARGESVASDQISAAPAVNVLSWDDGNWDASAWN